MKTLRLCALAFVLGAFATAASANVQPTADSSPLTPEKIYVFALRAMREVPQPVFVTFRETVVGRNFTLHCTNAGISLSPRHGDVTGTYDVSFRARDGSALSQPVGVANASPCPGALLAPAGESIASLGLPQASPSPTTGAPTAAPDARLDSPIIGAVHVYAARFYHIELVGLEQLGGNEVYHLKLHAYQDPNTHPLTDLFVDPKTYLVREARGEVAGHYVVASGSAAGVVDFDRVGKYWLVKHEHFELAGNALFVHTRMSVTVDGSNFATPNELPEIIFPPPPGSTSPKATPSAGTK